MNGVNHWLLRGRLVAGLLVAAGVLCGALGFAQNGTGMSWPDALYGALQLAVLAGPTGEGADLPVLLEIGRFIAPAATVVTAALTLMRYGTITSDRQRARRATGHCVVLGDSEAAQQFAVASANAASHATERVRRSGPRTVYISEADDDTDARLRQRGVVVVRRTDREATGRALDDARKVVIVPAHDDAVFADLELISGPLTSREVDVRVLLRSSEIAEQLRRRHFDGTESPTIVSVAELAAFHLTGKDFFPRPLVRRPLHLVVVGAGEVAAEVAAALLSRHARRGMDPDLDLIEVGPDEWAGPILDRAMNTSATVSRYCWPNVRAEHIEGLCTAEHRLHHVFIVGLPDTRTYPVGARLAESSRNIGVTALGHDSWSTNYLRTTQVVGGGEVRATTIAELLGRVEALAVGITERLGDALLDELLVLNNPRLYPSDSRVIEELLRWPEHAGREWCEQLAGSLIDQLTDAGYRLTLSRPGMSDGLMSVAALSRTMGQHLSTLRLDDLDPATCDGCMRVAVDVPDLLRSIGVALIDTREVSA